MTCDLVIAGTGSLARQVGYSLAVQDQVPLGVAVLGRSPGRAAELAWLANTRAALSGTRTRFTSHAFDAARPDETGRVLARLAPRIVLNCASLQSPWEAGREPSAWTRLLADGGFGLGLPLQATLAAALAEAVRDSGVPARFVNASFPDAVNPVLTALGLPVFCGVGNVAILAASLHAGLGAPRGTVRVLAHHAHLHAPADPADEARAWTGDRPLPDVGGLLAAQRAVPREELNVVTGHATARLLTCLLAGDDVRTSLPGPLGLPGGYPVRASLDRIALDLPAGLSRAEAVAFQLRAAAADGVVVDEHGTARFGERAVSALARHLPDLAGPLSDGVAAGALPALGERLLRLRTALRARPAV